MTATNTTRPTQQRSMEATDLFGDLRCPWEIAVPDEDCPVCGEHRAAQRARAGRIIPERR